MIDYCLILIINYSGKQWSLDGNSYDGLVWQDESPKPTKEELDSLWETTKETVAKKECKEKAKKLLAESDWSVLSDVGLANQSDFISYRSNLRSLVINPQVNTVFPTEPEAVWL